MTTNITEIEKELVELINLDKKNWTHFYILLKKIENERLWSEKFNSFTAWVKDFAIKNKTHESIIWSKKKAGEVYQKYARVKKEKGIDVVPLEEVTIAQDTLVLLDKISNRAPALGADLTEKALNKEIKKKDLQEAYKSLRDKSYITMQLDKRIEKEIKNLDMSPIDPIKEVEKIAITATEIITTLYGTEWLNVEVKKKYFKTSFEQNKYRLIAEFPVYPGTSKKSRRIDALICENVSSQNSWELNLHAVEIKVSKSDLIHDTKYTEYAEFVDFLWLAIPKELLKVAKKTKPEACGIIVISNKNAKIIEQAAKLDSSRKLDTLNNLALKLL